MQRMQKMIKDRRTKEKSDAAAAAEAAAIHANLLKLPPLQRRGEAVSQYLRRQPLWQQWREQDEADGVHTRPYSFRNSYSVRCHLHGIPSAQVADAMGHSDLTHNTHYTTSTAASTSEVFDRIINN